ncbi:MAG: cyclodeaminase/cyclohydrolase family protein [Deltaproteobacteria bacterium]|jgi:formiminotetrahydrofolate cyclodeaminase|nr:cyclodeaminase/cyclohydrolase family protein [Deltaproteobacteria bacterium]
MRQDATPVASAFKLPFEDFLAAAASRCHVPGGGSATAAAGCLGAAMGAMVANLTLGKKGCEDHQEEAAASAGAFLNGLEAFKSLAVEDMEAFDAVMVAYRLPKSCPEELSARGLAVEAALRRAVLAPLGIARKAAELMDLNRRLAAFGNAGAVNDCGVAAVLLEATARAAMLSADVNLPSLQDGELKEEVKGLKGEFLEGLGQALRETMELVEARRS